MSRYCSERNRLVPPAAQGEFAPLFIGPLRVSPPVVLAPMAGVTNAPFRTLCRHFGAGLFVSEMIAARALVEGNPRTERLASFAAGESPRSLQLYATEPRSAGEAVARLVGEGRVDHIDLNFGCPVPKVTRRGGGAAIPLKPRLLQSIVRAAVSRAAATPVTMKFRTGIDENLQTFLDSGRIAQEEGCAAVALHARSAAQLYDGAANWSKIAALKDALREIPVLGNGDIWEAQDALRMMRSTGCDGVVVGRGCLGRPWLFRDLADVYAGRAPQDPPRLGEIAALMLQLAQLLAGHFGEGPGLRAFRKHAAWFTKGFPGSAQLRARLVQVCSLDDLRAALTGLNPALPFPPQAMRVPRGKKSGRQRVALPPGYLRQLDSATPPPREAEAALSGG